MSRDRRFAWDSFFALNPELFDGILRKRKDP